MNIAECLQKRFLIKISPDDALLKKELLECGYDSKKAKETIAEEDYKWSTVQSYYAMFHAARALLFKLGYREKKHFAIVVVLEDMDKQGKLESSYVDSFKAAIAAREDADYHYIYSKETAEESLKTAQEFVERIKALLPSLSSPSIDKSEANQSKANSAEINRRV